jgi:superfamily II DNA or RNA helicase
MASFSEFLGSLDADAGKRGKQFEYFVKWFLKNEPLWSTQVDKVWLWEEWPQRWGPDCGIDLIFKHKDGQTWAVQSKCYDPKYNITKHDVDKFLSESNRADIDKRLLIATTDGLGANAKQVCDAQDKEVVRYLLSHFEDADIEYPSSLSDLNNAKPKPKPTPKPHQVDAIGAVKKGFAGTDRGQLIMACGTGKTFTTLWIKEALNSESTLILLPSLGLLSQTLHEWTAAKNQDFAVLCVCSDESVGKNSGDEAVHDIADLAFPVSSDSVEIRKFLEIQGPKVVFSTYQSSNLIADAQTDQKVPAFNLAIADEAHRCAGDKAGNFATILDGQRIRADKRLFATATPRTYSTALKKGAEGRGIEIVGMDNEEVFGQQLYTLNFGEAIKRGLLTDYRVVIVGVDSPMIASYIENREFVKTESGIENDAETLAAQVALLKAMKDFDLHRMISFHSRVNRAEGFAKDLIDVAQWLDAKHRPSGELKTDFVSGEMPTFARRQKLSILKNANNNERTLLTNARCLSEGVDVPSLDGVAFIDPRASQVDIIQAVGRAIRLSPNKKAGTIVLPVFIRDGDNSEQSLDEGNFKPIWDVLNALKSHDDVLADELDQMRVGMGKRGSSKVQGGFSKIEFDLPASVDKSFTDAIQTRLVESTTANWDAIYGELLRYIEQNASCLVPAKFRTKSGIQLGYWISTQRKDKDIMSAERRQKLEAIQDWSWDALEDRWYQGLNYLKSYLQEYGDAHVPYQYKTEDGFPLGNWVQRYRKIQSELTPERIKDLEAIPGWTWEKLGNKKWKDGIEHLEQYVFENGDALVSPKFTSQDGYKLGQWATSVRTAYKKNSLSEEKISQMESFHKWSWSYLDGIWERNMSLLEEYVKRHGDALVPIKYITDLSVNLGGWVAQERGRKDILTLEQRNRFESLHGWTWDPLETKWNEALKELEKFVQSEGHCLPPQRLVMDNGFALGAWVVNQRISRNKMTKERIDRLESIPGWLWDIRDSQWLRNYEALTNYVKEHGDSLVPKRATLPDGLRLGQWVQNQRSDFKDKNLIDERVRKLESLSGWSWNPTSDKWDRGYQELKEYLSAGGSFPISARVKSANGFSLGSWVRNQNKKAFTLSPEQKRMLDEIGFVWKS